jgi:glycerophosphoryl diester phosphodiesterase
VSLRIAHRGLPHRLRENTLPSFALAIELGADGLELDVHATRDGVIVVHHNPVLPDGRALATMSSATLAEHELAPGIGIPTLADVCALAAARAILFVELKGAHIEEAVTAVLAAYAGTAAIHSFDHRMIARLSAAGVPWALGLLYEADASTAAADMARHGARDIWPHHSLVTPALVDAVHARDGRVFPWTVNEPALARHLTAAGVDGLCGDDITIF